VEVGVEYRATEENVVGVEVRGSWDNWKSGISLRLVESGWFAAVLGFPVSCLGREYDFKFILNASNWTTSLDFPINYDSKGFANNCLLVTEDAYIRAPIGRMNSMEGLRRYLNGLHLRMAEKGYGEVEVTRTNEVLMVVRTNPVTLEAFVLLARSGEGWTGWKEWKMPGKVDRVECVAKLTVQSHYGKEEGEWVEGLPCVVNSYRALQWFGSISNSTVSLHTLPGSFICVLHTSQGGRVLESLRLFHTHTLPALLAPKSPLSLLSLSQLVYLLWRSSPEETLLKRHARDIYKVPGLSALPYAGLGGLALAIRNSAGKDYISDNLAQGNWLIDYHCQRVADWPLPDGFKSYFWKAMDQIKTLPRKHIPAHFLRFVQTFYSAASVYLRDTLFEAGSERLRKEPENEDLLLACTPFYGAEKGGKTQGLAAGLPFNALGSSRRRGRDTFIAFQGLYLVTGRYREGQRELLEFATAVQEGVVPNHLCPETGTFEYHTRDATWWFIRAVRDFVSTCGTDILRQPIEPWFTDKRDLTLADVLQNIMQKHAVGVHFYNATHGLKMHPNWNDIGADIHLDFDSETGLLIANPHSHTDTWHLQQALRDGAAIEVTALLYSSVLFLAELSAKGLISAAGVHLNDGSILTYAEWANRIKACFEPLYWWPVEDITSLVNPLVKRPSGFYKDTVGAANFETEAVLRPSQCLAMAIAPDLFDPDHACTALLSVEKLLWDGVGLRQQTGGQVVLWVAGFYLKARAIFLGESRIKLLGMMKRLKNRMSESAWLGLPNLVESGEGNGTEARSVGAFVEALDFVLSLDN
jgi:glycogen debranching enzyme